MRLQPPEVILAGVNYTGVPTPQWVAHTHLRIESEIQARRAAKAAAYAELFEEGTR